MAKIITLKNDKQHPVAKADLVKYIPEYNNLRASNPDFKKTVDYMYETRLGYVYAMRDFLPSGLKGLLLVAFLAAYMSTISTQLNWGASYFVNDLYKRFLRKEQTFSDTKTADKHYVTAARIFTLVAMAISLFATTQISSIRGVWGFVVECGAGLGLVLILRWYWWRINAWSEIAATATPFIGYSISKFYFGWSFPDNPEALFFTVGITTVVWIAVTFITKPEPINVLGSFYERVQPGGAWKPVRQHLNTTAPSENLWALLFSWVGAILFTYSLLFGIGKIIFGEWILAAELATTALAGFLLMRFGMRKTEAK
ncbi:MAG: hypothetical protein NTX03_12405 [Bacteroidetes bacterium]|nr:hypothetical protein [Bacteroidota bacterium]